jgi:hypothetical protein
MRWAIALQVTGLAFDAVWHGLLRPDFEATTVEEMAFHLATVHLPLYLGVLAVLATTTWALVERTNRIGPGIALPVAFTGALVAAAGEVWHAYTHLQLSTHAGPIAGGLAVFGLVVVVVASWFAGRGERRRAADGVERRAA